MAKACDGVAKASPPVGTQSCSATWAQVRPPSVVRIMTAWLPANCASGSGTPTPSVGLAKTNCSEAQAPAIDGGSRSVIAVQLAPASVVRSHSGWPVALVVDDVSN